MNTQLNAADQEQLLKLHAEWKAAEDNIPAKEWEKGYKHRQSVARKKWKAFSDFCGKHSLNAVQLGIDINLTNFKFKIAEPD